MSDIDSLLATLGLERDREAVASNDIDLSIAPELELPRSHGRLMT